MNQGKSKKAKVKKVTLICRLSYKNYFADYIEEIRHGFYGLSGFTLKLFIKIRVNRLNRRFSVSDFLLFTNKFL
jgi:hypothetical protein